MAQHVLSVLRIFHRGAVGDEDRLRIDFADLGVHFLGAFCGHIDGLAGVISADSALGGAGVEAEDIRGRLFDHPHAVFQVEGETDAHHVHLLGQLEHVDLHLEGDAALPQHLTQVGIFVDVTDRGADVGGRLDPHVLEVLKYRAHVAQRVVRIEACANERVAFDRRKDVLLGVIESLFVGVDVGPHHRHRPPAVGAQPSPTERVDAIDAGLLEKLRNQPAAGAGDHDRSVRIELLLKLGEDFLARGTR